MIKLIQSTILCLGLAVLVQSAYAGGDAAKGEKLVAICAACHGADGNSPLPTFPKLAGLGENYIYKQLRDIANTDPKKPIRVIVEMTGMLNNFSDQDLKDIAAWYAAQNMQLSGAKKIKLKLGSGLELEDGEALAYGEKLYRAGNAETAVAACTGCHSPRGQGNEPAGYPRLGGQYPDYIEKQLVAFQLGNRVNDEAEVMRNIAGKMSAAEIKAVANYIAGLQQE